MLALYMVKIASSWAQRKVSKKAERIDWSKCDTCEGPSESFSHYPATFTVLIGVVVDLVESLLETLEKKRCSSIPTRLGR